MKKGVLGVASFIAFWASVSAASAALVIPEQLKQLLQYIFVDLGKLGVGENTSALIFFKFLLWIICFILIYFGLEKSGVFGEKKNIVTTISIVLALMTTIMLPSSLVMTAFQTYSFIAGILLIALPTILGISLGTKTFHEKNPFNYFMRGIILFIIAYILGTLLASLLATGQALYMTFYEWGVWGVIGCVVAGIVNMLRAVGGRGAGARMPEFPGAPTAPGAPPVPPTVPPAAPKAEKAVIQEEEIEQAMESLEKASETMDNVEAKNLVPTVQDINAIEKALLALKPLEQQMQLLSNRQATPETSTQLSQLSEQYNSQAQRIVGFIDDAIKHLKDARAAEMRETDIDKQMLRQKVMGKNRLTQIQAAVSEARALEGSPGEKAAANKLVSAHNAFKATTGRLFAELERMTTTDLGTAQAKLKSYDEQINFLKDLARQIEIKTKKTPPSVFRAPLRFLSKLKPAPLAKQAYGYIAYRPLDIDFLLQAVRQIKTYISQAFATEEATRKQRQQEAGLLKQIRAITQNVFNAIEVYKADLEKIRSAPPTPPPR